MDKDSFLSKYNNEEEFPDWLKLEIDLIYTRMKNTKDSRHVKMYKSEVSQRAISIMKSRKFKISRGIDLPTSLFGHWRSFWKITW